MQCGFNCFPYAVGGKVSSFCVSLFFFFFFFDGHQCHADRKRRQRAPFGIDQGRHQCKDWNRIEEWMKSRTVDIYQPGLLMHPEFGMHFYLALFGDEQLTHS